VTSRKRKSTFRLLAIALGFAIVLTAELCCRAFGWGLAEQTDDPFVGFESVVPLFVENDAGDEMKIAEGRLRFFAEDSFSKPKQANTYRIFCLGGSTVQGRPFSIETSFTTWLEQSLSVTDPSRKYEVVNCGGVSYASYRLVPILTECLKYQPDLIVVCTGHNEFLEDRTYSNIKSSRSAYRLLGQSRLFTLMRSAAMPDRSERDQFLLNTDVNARLDYDDGLQFYNRDDEWRDQIVDHFESNLRRMADACRQQDTPLLFMLPPSNLSGSPPFKTVPDESVADEVRKHILAARDLYESDLATAVQELESAVQLDPRHAANLFELGRVCESASRIEAARRAFIQARDEDVCPLRMISSLEGRFRRVADDAEVPLLDLHEILETKSKSTILGDGLLVDHIHPSFGGHQLIAKSIVKHLIKMKVVKPEPKWGERSESVHREHFKSLDNLYFLRGQRTLENLKRWARGRGHNLPKRQETDGKAPDNR
jgi:lysophospholipase L1-like esterase